MSEVVALIPARAGSKGVPGKNIRLLGGYSLLAWSIAASLKTKSIDRVIVSTDSEEYATLARELGADVPFLRPAELSGDSSTDYDFVLHSLNWLRENSSEPDYIVHIRPTTPFREPEMIEQAIKQFKSAITATAMRSVHEMSESAYKTFEIASTGVLQCVGSGITSLDAANNARQGFAKTYQANGYVDILLTSFIRKQGLLHGDSVLPFITPVVTEVDSEEDFSYLEYQLLHSPAIESTLFS